MIALAGKFQGKGNCLTQLPYRNWPVSRRISRLYYIFNRPPTLVQINCQNYKKKKTEEHITCR